jgi:hypothetical protein
MLMRRSSSFSKNARRSSSIAVAPTTEMRPFIRHSSAASSSGAELSLAAATSARSAP